MGGAARANSLEHNARSGFHSGWRISGAGIAAALNQWPLVVVLLAAALVRITLLLINLQGHYAKLDFSSYYEGAFAMRHGLNPYTMNLTAIGERLGLQTGDMFHIAETPAFLASFEPLSLLAPRAAYLTWMALNAGAFVAAMTMLLWRADEMKWAIYGRWRPPQFSIHRSPSISFGGRAKRWCCFCWCWRWSRSVERGMRPRESRWRSRDCCARSRCCSLDICFCAEDGARCYGWELGWRWVVR
jgi:hypothetical protein